MRTVAVIYNARSGALLAGGDGIEDKLRALFLARRLQVELRPFNPLTVRTDVAELLASDPECLFVAGGDGTILAVAGCMPHAESGKAVPLGILPCGTMNVLARDLGIPPGLDAIDVLLDGAPERIDVARVNDHVFLCSSLVGLFPHLGRLREEGRGKVAPLAWPSLLLRSWRLLRRFPRLTVTLTADGARRTEKTRAIAVANNAFSEEASLMPTRDSLSGGRLAVYILRERSLWEMLKLVFAMARHRWPSRRHLTVLQASSVEMDFAHLGITSVMSDGEAQQLTTPLHFTISPRALAVLRPAVRQAAAA